MTKIFTASKSMTSGLSNAVSTVSVALFIAEKNWYKVQKVLELPPLASVFMCNKLTNVTMQCIAIIAFQA